MTAKLLLTYIEYCITAVKFATTLSDGILLWLQDLMALNAESKRFHKRFRDETKTNVAASIISFMVHYSNSFPYDAPLGRMRCLCLQNKYNAVATARFFSGSFSTQVGGCVESSPTNGRMVYRVLLQPEVAAT